MHYRRIRLPFTHLTIETTQPAFCAYEVLGDNVYDDVVDQTFHLKLDLPLPSNHTRFGSSNAPTYRERMFDRGLYLGHHFGKTAELFVGDSEMWINVHPADEATYNTIVWTYAIKLILSLSSLQNDALHLKSTALLNGNNVVLLMGRGNAGKTTAARLLEDKLECAMIANTHCVVQDQHVWGVNTWVRHRTTDGEESYVLKQPCGSQEGELRRIIIFEHNERGEFVCERIDAEMAESFILYFAASIGNYDLKEDITDYRRRGTFSDRHAMLRTEIDKVRQLVAANDVVYVSCDSFDSRASQALENYICEVW